MWWLPKYNLETHIICGWDGEEEGDGDDTDGQAKVDAALVLQLGSHPGELEGDVDGEDDQAEGGEEVVECEEEGVEGAVSRGLLPVVVHIVLHKEGGNDAAVQEIYDSHGGDHCKRTALRTPKSNMYPLKVSN